jgi:hypothetical protein
MPQCFQIIINNENEMFDIANIIQIELIIHDLKIGKDIKFTKDVQSDPGEFVDKE